MAEEQKDNIIRLEYKGWKIVAHHQCHIPPFKEYVAIATVKWSKNGGLFGFNSEGNSIEEAVQKVKEKIDRCDL